MRRQVRPRTQQVGRMLSCNRRVAAADHAARPANSTSQVDQSSRCRGGSWPSAASWVVRSSPPGNRCAAGRTRPSGSSPGTSASRKVSDTFDSYHEVTLMPCGQWTIIATVQAGQLPAATCQTEPASSASATSDDHPPSARADFTTQCAGRPLRPATLFHRPLPTEGLPREPRTLRAGDAAPEVMIPPHHQSGGSFGGACRRFRPASHRLNRQRKSQIKSQRQQVPGDIRPHPATSRRTNCTSNVTRRCRANQ